MYNWRKQLQNFIWRKGDLKRFLTENGLGSSKSLLPFWSTELWCYKHLSESYLMNLRHPSPNQRAVLRKRWNWGAEELIIHPRTHEEVANWGFEHSLSDLECSLYLLELWGLTWSVLLLILCVDWKLITQVTMLSIVWVCHPHLSAQMILYKPAITPFLT